jgi:hypothetical protein
MYVARILFFLILLPGIIYSQGIKIGIDWDTPNNAVSFTEQLNIFKESGISIIQIEGILPQNQIQSLKQSNIEIWVSSGLKFTRRFDFINTNQLLNTVTDPIYYYQSNNLELLRYTLIEQPQIFPGINDSMRTLVQAVRSIYSGPLDILTHTQIELDQLLNVEIINTTRDILSIDTSLDTPYIYFSAAALKDKPSVILRELWSNPEFQNLTYLFHSEDFFDFIRIDDDFLKLVSEYTLDVNAVVALQIPEIDVRRGTTTEAILLLIGLIIFVSIYLSNAGYQRSVTRFTTTHNFYVNDVMMRRIRAGGDVLFAWIMTFLFGGILFHVTMNATANIGTSQMLNTHYPFIYAIVSSGTIPQLILSSVFIILIQLVTFIWITLATKLRFQPSQILQLYLIPQQIIIIFTLVALLIFLNNGSAVYLVIFTILGFSMIFLSFHIISFDLIKYSQKNKLFFLLTGPVLYTIVLIILFSWLYQSTPFIDTILLYLQIAGI